MDLVTLPEREFKIKIINILMEVWKDIQELRNGDPIIREHDGGY